VLAVAGGIGVTPFLALASSLLSSLQREEEEEEEKEEEEEGEEELSWEATTMSSSVNSVNQGLLYKKKKMDNRQGVGGSRGGRLRHVTPNFTLVWSVQTPEMLGVGAEALCALLDRGGAGRVTLHLHVTAKQGWGGVGLGSVANWPSVLSGHCTHTSAERLLRMASGGRPDLEALVEEYCLHKGGGAAAQRGQGQDSGVNPVVLACGPVSLTHSATRAAQKHGVRVLSEVFHL